MQQAPLTHHDIIELVLPFTRRGRHVDLNLSQRQDRRLAFKPVDHAGGNADLPDLRETLQLEGLASGSWRLTRTLTAYCGLQASAQALGRQLDDLLARIEAVPLRQQFRAGPGYLLARSYSADGDATPLTRGVLQVPGLRLTLNVPESRRMPGDIELTPTQTQAPQLPDDLLAVLGWSWARLVPTKLGWTSKLRLRGTPTRRTERAEHALDRCAAHLAQTLAEPPARYHDRLRATRWGVVFRRAIPVLTAAGLVATVAFLPRFETQGRAGLWMLMYHVPTALIALSFCLQELARFEIPPLPRRSSAANWQAQGGTSVAGEVAAGSGGGSGSGSQLES